MKKILFTLIIAFNITTTACTDKKTEQAADTIRNTVTENLLAKDSYRENNIKTLKVDYPAFMNHDIMSLANAATDSHEIWDQRKHHPLIKAYRRHIASDKTKYYLVMLDFNCKNSTGTDIRTKVMGLVSPANTGEFIAWYVVDESYIMRYRTLLDALEYIQKEDPSFTDETTSNQDIRNFILDN